MGIVFTPSTSLAADQQTIVSEPIDAGTLTNIGNQYINHPNALKVLVGGHPQVLRGLRIDVEDLRSIIDRQDGVVITHVYVKFGVRPDDLGKPQDEQFFTTAFAGIAVDTAMPPNPNGKLMLDKLFDYCDPCPDKCPTGA